jgi:hypothetical protein
MQLGYFEGWEEANIQNNKVVYSDEFGYGWVSHEETKVLDGQ